MERNLKTALIFGGIVTGVQSPSCLLSRGLSGDGRSMAAVQGDQ